MRPVAVVPDTELEYVVRRFTLEKGYAVLGDELKDGQPVIRSVDEGRFRYDLPSIYIEQLGLLRPHFDVILVRAIGTGFFVLGIRKAHRSPREPVQKETLLSAGKACLHYSGKVSGQRLPVVIEVLEIHERDFDPKALVHLQDLTVWYPSEGVIVNVYAVGFASGRVWSRGHISHRGRGRRYLERILAAKDEPEHRIVEAVAASGVSLPPLLLGAVVGALLAFGLRYILFVHGAEDGKLYGLADYVGVTAAIGLAVFARRIRSSSVAQAVISALLCTVLLYGTMIVLFDAPFSFWMPVNALILSSTAVWIGRESEMS